MDKIEVRGVRIYNFKNINFVIFRDKFIVVIGFSGFGKFSFVFDILYVEG